MVADDDRPRSLETGVREDILELTDELRLSRRVADDRDEMDIEVGHARDALEHLKVADREVIGGRVGGEITRKDRGQSMRVDDAPGPFGSMGKAKDRVALARPQVVAIRTADDMTIGRVDREELVGTDAFLVDTARRQQQATIVGRPADAAPGPGHPAAPVEVAE